MTSGSVRPQILWTPKCTCGKKAAAAFGQPRNTEVVVRSRIRCNLKIYISATYRDLQKHRLAVLNILRRMGHQPIGMEDYSAEGVRPLSRCLDDVAACDAYLCIVAWRYGFVPHNGVPAHLLPAGGELGETSVTEFEYRKAIQFNKPILAFVLDGDAEWPSHFFDAVSGENENGGSVARFRQELSQQYLVSYFRSAEELASLVSAAIYRTEMARQMDLESLNIKATFNDPFKRNGPVTDSTLFEISNVIAGPEKVQALQVNIGSGSDWWMTRLYFICSLASDLTSIELVVCEAGASTYNDSQPRRFIGTIHPRIVKERLASQYEQLNRYECAIKESEPASDLLTEVSRRANVWTNIVDPGGIEAHQAIFVTEANLGRWLSPYLIGQAVDIDAGVNAALRVQRILDWPMRFVPITENGQFKQVVDKQALTEQIARLFIREQVSRALSTVR